MTRAPDEVSGNRCRVCGTSLTDVDPAAPADADVRLCSTGCVNVWEALGPMEPAPPDLEPAAEQSRSGAEPTRTPVEGGTESALDADSTDEVDIVDDVDDADEVDGDDADEVDGDDTDGSDSTRDDPPPITRTYLRIDGMHSATCEAYLESVAEALEGVVDAQASYVTESVRVEYDPTELTDVDLRDALTTVGYTAYLRDDSADATDVTGPTRRSREMSGLRKRRSDDMMEIRYVLGVVFGSFLLLPYITILYPAYLAELFPAGPLQSFEELFTDSGVLFLRVYFVLTGIVLWVTGMPLLRGAYVSLKMRRPTIDLLATVAIVAAFCFSTVAAIVGGNNVFFDLVLAVAALVMGALLYESRVKTRGLEELTRLTVSQVDTATRLEPDGSTVEIPVDDLGTDDTVLVRQGERIPIDGTLAEGTCTVDEAVMTGESVPVTRRAGDDLLGGSIVTRGAAVVDVGDHPSSSLERLTETVWDLQSATHGGHRRIDEFAGRVLPAIGAIAVLVGLGTALLSGSAVGGLLAFFAVAFVASPWMLGLAAPLSIASNLEAALERGIVVFDETVFGRIRDVDVVVFDKTGTITRGEMTVLETDAPAEALAAAGTLESHAAHPAGKAIAAAFGADGRTSTPTRADDDAVEYPTDAQADGGTTAAGSPAVTDFESHATGVEGTVDGERVLVGHPDLFADRDWSIDDDLAARVASERGFGRLPVVVGRDGVAEGVIVVGDEPRDGWDATVERLADRGLEVLIVTGDDAEATERFDDHPAVAHTIASVSPQGKVAAIRQLGTDRQVAMVGDGTNDAPALAEADLGISLGGGTDLASDASDLAIVDDDLETIDTTFALAEAAETRTRQNNRLALSYNVIAIALALMGVLNPLFIILAVVVGATAIFVNSFRPLV